MTRKVVILRSDGIKQHYNVKSNPKERGRVYDKHERAWRKPERGAPPIPPKPPIDVPPTPPPTELHSFEVVAHTNVTRGKGKKGLERIELRTTVRALDAEDAAIKGISHMNERIDAGYSSFLHKANVFQHISVSRVSDDTRIGPVNLYRHADGNVREVKEW